jgi:lysophospholipase L1-like esterase
MPVKKKSPIDIIREMQGNKVAPLPGEHKQSKDVTAILRSNAVTDFKSIYSSDAHTWNPDYVFPTKYTLDLSIDGVAATREKPILWTISSPSEAFDPVEAKQTGQTKGRVGASIELPELGEFHISVQQEGKNLVPSFRYFASDILIVSIGDSYSSGQGNPDKPGTPTAAGRGLCVPVKIRKVWEGTMDWLDDPDVPFISDIPGVGDVVDFSIETFGDVIEGLADVTMDLTPLDELLDPMRPGPTWLERKAWRSLQSAPALAAQQVANPAQGRLVTFVSFASSGATMKDGLLEPQYDFQKVGQIEEARQLLVDPRDHRKPPRRFRRPIDVLILSIGGNDAGFAGTLEDMTKNVTIFQSATIGEKAGDVKEVVQKLLDGLPEQYDGLAKAIKNELNPTTVVVPEYPAPIFDGSNGKSAKGCGLFEADGPMGIGVKEAMLIEALGNGLNDEVKDAAAEHNWFFVSGISDQFKGHGYCTDDHWYVQAEESCLTQGDFEGVVHPNPKGTKVVAQALAREITAILNQLHGSDAGKFARS